MNLIIQSAVTVADLSEHGIDSVDAFCDQCGNLWKAPIHILPRTTTLAKISALMACPNCGGRHVDVTVASLDQHRAAH
jgi:hypothetical protein